MSDSAETVKIDPHPETRVAAALARFPEVARVWLFGSRARGDHMSKADIDVAIECDGLSAERWLDMKEAAEDSTLYRVDVIRFDDAGDLLPAIRRDGRLLYERA